MLTGPFFLNRRSAVTRTFTCRPVPAGAMRGRRPGPGPLWPVLVWLVPVRCMSLKANGPGPVGQSLAPAMGPGQLASPSDVALHGPGLTSWPGHRGPGGGGPDGSRGSDAALAQGRPVDAGRTSAAHSALRIRFSSRPGPAGQSFARGRSGPLGQSTRLRDARPASRRLTHLMANRAVAQRSGLAGSSAARGPYSDSVPYCLPEGARW
jgi:hypothetical protein